MAHLRAASFLPNLLLPPTLTTHPAINHRLPHDSSCTAGLSCYFEFHEFMCHFPNSVLHASRRGTELHPFILPVGVGDSLLFTENPLCANTSRLT